MLAACVLSAFITLLANVTGNNNVVQHTGLLSEGDGGRPFVGEREGGWPAASRDLGALLPVRYILFVLVGLVREKGNYSYYSSIDSAACSTLEALAPCSIYHFLTAGYPFTHRQLTMQWWSFQ